MSIRTSWLTLALLVAGCSHGVTSSGSSSSGTGSTRSATGTTGASSSTSGTSSTSASSGTGTGSGSSSGSASSSSTAGSSGASSSGGSGHSGAALPCSPLATPLGEPELPLANTPGDVLLADVNEDGALDAIAIELRGIEVALGNGDGTFRPAAPMSFGNANYGAVAGDWNRDGHVDLAVADSSGGLVHLLFGDGAGRFTERPLYISDAPFSIAKADFNADGLDDLVVATVSSRAELLLGLADGGFQNTPAVSGIATVTYGPGQRLVAAVPIDGGAVAVGPANDALVIMRMLPDGGGLDAPTRITTGYIARAVAVGDLDHDGILDVALLQLPNGYGIFGQIDVMHGHGDGSFDAPVASSLDPVEPGEPGSYAFAAADLGDDAGVQILVADGAWLAAFPTVDGGALGPAVAYQAAQFAEAAVGDLNGDGRSDLLIAGGAPASAVGFLQPVLNSGGGRFGAPVLVGQTHPNNVAGLGQPVAGDFTGDGRDDLIFSGFYPEPAGFHLFPGVAGAPLFGPEVLLDAGTVSASQVAMDFNGDGALDIFSGDYGGVLIWLGRGDGTFGAALQVSPDGGGLGTAAHSELAANLLGGPDLDVAATVLQSATLMVAEGYGDGGFAPEVRVPIPLAAYNLAAQDLDGDGTVDLAACGDAGAPTLMLLHNDGSANFSTLAQTPVDGCSDLVAADLDGDGGFGWVLGTSDGFEVVRWSASGGFALERHSGTRSPPLRVVVRDFDRDGRPDIALDTGDSLALSLRRDGGFTDPQQRALTGYSESMAAVDADGDGRPDFAIGDRQYGSSVMLNRCP